jgi:hypothetical protein
MSTPPSDSQDEIRESRLLEQARASLSKGQSEDALRSLSLAGVFSRSDLAEERDALTVMALARSGDAPGARRQLATFMRLHPESLYLSKLRAEVETSTGD